MNFNIYPYFGERSEHLAKSLLFAKSEGASRLGNRLLLKHNKLCFTLQPFPRLSAKATFADYKGFKKNGAKLPFDFILLKKFVKEIAKPFSDKKALSYNLRAIASASQKVQLA